MPTFQIERPVYRWFIHGYPNSSTDEGHLGWLFTVGLPWFRRCGQMLLFGQRFSVTLYLHSEGLSLTHRACQLGLWHRYGNCARDRKPLLAFGAYGFYCHRLAPP